MPEWVAATMDDVLGTYQTKRDALAANRHADGERVMRVGAGDYEVRPATGGRWFWVMTRAVATRHGFPVVSR